MLSSDVLKLIIVGDSAVGKTKLLTRFCDNQYRDNYVSTIGVDFKVKTIEIKGSKVKFQIWDTAGQERYRTIAQTYYRGASGVILMYSISDKSSFVNIQRWMSQIKQNSNSEISQLLVGNKSDDQEARIVQTEEGEALARKYEINFMETSAKLGVNVKEAFMDLANQIMSKKTMYNSEIIPKGQKLTRKIEVEEPEGKCMEC